MKKSLFNVAAGLLAIASVGAQAAGYYGSRTSASTTLSDVPGQFVTVAQISVPAGKWMVAAKASLVSYVGADIVRCSVFSGGVQLDSAATMIGRADNYPFVAELVNMGRINLADTTTVQLACEHDGNSTGVYVDPGAWLQVTKQPT